MRSLTFFLCVAGVLAAVPALGATVDVFPAADTTIFEDPNGAVSNGRGTFLFAGRSNQGTGSIRRALMRFDLGALPAGARVDGVSLRLHASRSRFASEMMGLHRAGASWGEGASDAEDEEGGGDAAQPGDATWLHRFYPGAEPGVAWANAGGDFDPVPSASLLVDTLDFLTWTSAPMAADVQGWLDAPGMNFGYFLIGDEAELGTAYRFDSRENTETYAPRLRIEYTVVPGVGAGWVAVVGGGVFGVRRRARGR